MVKRLDRSTSVPMADDQVPLPVTRYRAILCLSRAAGDHHLITDMCPGFGLRPRAWRAQRAPGAQVTDQLSLEGAPPLNVERLVDGFMGNAHGLIIREVHQKAVGNLLR